MNKKAIALGGVAGVIHPYPPPPIPPPPTNRHFSRTLSISY